MQADSSPIVPWYKQFWPWFLMAIPFSSVCVGSFYIYHAVSGQDPMVQEQYYAAGQAINTVIAAGQHAQQMQLSAQLTFSPSQVVLIMSNPQGHPLPPVLTLQLSHPTIAELDQSVTMVSSTPGQYSGTLKKSSASRWDITMAAPDNSWSLSGVWHQDLGQSTQLTPTDVHEAEN
jgi:hypothetical protein